MRKLAIFGALFAILAIGLWSAEVFARGGGGGGGGGRGGGGGGGGSRAGGGGGASAASRPAASSSASRSPSMSRPAPSASRPAQTPSAGASAGNRPAAPSGAAGGKTASGKAALQSPQSYQKPSSSQVSSFINTPQAGAKSSAGSPAAAKSSSSGGPQSKSVTTPGGSTITVAGGGGSKQTAGGATVGGGAGAVKVEGAGGGTAVKAGGAAGISKGGQTAVAGASLAAARNQWGYTGAKAGAGASVNGRGQAAAIGGIRGPGGNAVTAGRGASFVNGQFVGGNTWRAVNGAYTRWGAFGPGWAGRYPGAWWPGKWTVATSAWAGALWGTAGGYCGCEGEGSYYDYGGNVTYDDGTVYYGEEAVASAEQYYDQAGQIAATGEAAENEDWLPLGVFAVITEPAQTQTDKVVQLALNKEGAIRGNLQDATTDKVIPVTGAVDKKTQRVAIKMEGNDSAVLETGLYNLTNDEVPVLLHFGPDRQEPRTLMRLQPPEDQQQPTK
jgi:hypothetical protein